MARRAFFPRSNDIDLSDSHIELVRYDLRPREKRAYVCLDCWQSKDSAVDGEAPIHQIHKWLNHDELKALHTLVKGKSGKGLLVLIAAVEEFFSDIDTDESGDFCPTYGSVSATTVDPLA